MPAVLATATTPEKAASSAAQVLATRAALIMVNDAGNREGVLGNEFVQNVIGRRATQPAGMTVEAWNTTIKPSLVDKAQGLFTEADAGPKPIVGIAKPIVASLMKTLNFELAKNIQPPDLSGSWLTYITANGGNPSKYSGITGIKADPRTDWCVRTPLCFYIPHAAFAYDWGSVADLNLSTLGCGNVTGQGLSVNTYPASGFLQAPAFLVPSRIPKFSTSGKLEAEAPLPWEPPAALLKPATLDATSEDCTMDDYHQIATLYYIFGRVTFLRSYNGRGQPAPRTDFFGNELTLTDFDTFRGAWKP